MGHANPRIPSPPPPFIWIANDVIDGALVDDIMLGQHVDVFLRSHVMPHLTEGVVRIVGVADAPATGDDTPATRGPASPAGDAVFPLRHPVLPISITFQCRNGLLDELPL